MISTLKQLALVATGFVSVLALSSTMALSEGDHAKHGTDKKIVDCHNAHDKMKAGNMDAAHMTGCHDKDGKLIGNADGHMGADTKMPMGDHKMGK